jgi:hypothetical protein
MRTLHSCISVTVVCAFLLGILSGCAKAPDQEYAAAKAAMKAAQDVEADIYMPNNFSNVQKAFQTAEDELVLQNSKFALSRNYKRTIALLNNVTTLASELTNDAPGKKEEIKTEVEKGLASVKKMAEETRVDIKKAPRRTFDKKAKAKMTEDLNAAESALAQASSEFESGKIMEARQKLGEAQKLLKKIFDKLSTGGTKSLM